MREEERTREKERGKYKKKWRRKRERRIRQKKPIKIKRKVCQNQQKTLIKYNSFFFKFFSSYHSIPLFYCHEIARHETDDRFAITVEYCISRRRIIIKKKTDEKLSFLYFV